jgi:hypothetical protein
VSLEEEKKRTENSKVSYLTNKDRKDILSHCFLPSAGIINIYIYMRLSIIRFVSLLSSKITQPHLSMNNLFPPINGHSRPPSEDLHGVSSGGVADIHSASKQQQIRRPPQTMDQQRRSPLRSNSLLTTATARKRYLTTAAAVHLNRSKVS